MGTNHISGTAEARVVKCCIQVDCVNSQHTDDKARLIGACVRLLLMVLCDSVYTRHRMITRDASFLVQKISAKFERVHPNIAASMVTHI